MPMKEWIKYLLLLLTIPFLSLPLSAQELKVRSLELLQDDETVTSEEYQRKDLINGDYAGLVKVMIALEHVEFDGGMLLDQTKVDVGEYWVWLANGATKLIVRAPGFLPLEVNFRDYSIVVHSRLTYRLDIAIPSGAMQSISPTTTFSVSSSPDGSVQTFTLNNVSLKMLKVEGGTFRMGGTPEQGSDADDTEKPVHNVTLDSYMIGETEVTQDLWEAVMGTNPSEFKGQKNPVENVSWDDCYAFIDKLNALTGQQFRLPTEAEWEYAARGGNKSQHYKYSGSDTLSVVAWFWQNSGNVYLEGNDSDWDEDKIKSNHCQTHPVATKRPNELGIYDMRGNVLEWCEDRACAYDDSAQRNPQGAPTGFSRLCRGGTWILPSKYCRVSRRFACSPDSRDSYSGFRLAL